MSHTYQIKGMTCSACVAKVKSELLKIGDVTSADVQLTAPQATINMQKHISANVLQQAIEKAGNYQIEMNGHQPMKQEMADETGKTSLITYKPLLLVFAFITGIAFLTSFYDNNFNPMQWMNHFMAGFFITFSFFKFLDIKGFATSYSSYDVLA